jgi:hypothetical protein
MRGGRCVEPACVSIMLDFLPLRTRGALAGGDRHGMVRTAPVRRYPRRTSSATSSLRVIGCSRLAELMRQPVRALARRGSFQAGRGKWHV